MAETPAKKGPVVVSVLNLKGGVGKTTVAALLARYAAGMREHSTDLSYTDQYLNVLAVDLDPQANLSQALMGDGQYQAFMNDQKPSIVELFDNYIPPSSGTGAPTPATDAQHFAQKTRQGNLEIIPSRFDFSDNLIKSVRTDEKILAKFISAHMRDKDLILIDCAPTESILTRAAYHASRYVLIPVKTEFFSTIGFPLMKTSLDKFRRENPAHAIDVCGILVNKTDTENATHYDKVVHAMAEITEMAKKCGWNCFSGKMTNSRGYPQLVESMYAHPKTNARREFFGVWGAKGRKSGWGAEVIRSIGLSIKE